MKAPRLKKDSPPPRRGVIQQQESSNTMGCMVLFLLVTAVIGGVIYLTQQNQATKPELQGKALTKAAPLEKAAGKPANKTQNGIKLTVDEKPPAEGSKEGKTGVSLSLSESATVAPPPMVGGTAAVDQSLANETVCFHGKRARHGPSMFTSRGFAVTFGSDTYNDGGQPLPRLEIFPFPGDAPTMASVLSMTEEDMKEFPNNHEVPVPYTGEVLAKTIARWIVAVATETCPPQSPVGH